MRVAILSANARAGDAIGNVVAEKALFFQERGADVRVFLDSIAGLHPVCSEVAQVVDPNQPGQALEFLHSADLICVEYSQYYALLDLVPTIVGLKPRIIFDYHGVTPAVLWGKHNREGVVRGAQFRGLLASGDLVLVHSEFAAHELISSIDLPRGRLRKLIYPIEDHFHSSESTSSRLRSALHLEHAIILLFVGRLAPNKNAGLLVEALDRLRDRQPPVHAVFVGDTEDTYAEELNRIRNRAEELGLADRLHFLGKVNREILLDAYRSADIFIMPSLHEGFSIPVVEAMASGLPVLAATTSALPETVGDAGFTFEPDDAEDLAGLVEQVLDDNGSAISGERLRVALVSFRYGADFAGGAESSLRKIATSLHATGHHIEVFTTSTRSESHWKNELPAGTTTLDGIPCHRFPIDQHDRKAHLLSLQRLLSCSGASTGLLEKDYLTHSIHSTALLDALESRTGDFDAVIVGPYLFGLTADIAARFKNNCILLPCFHREPLARLGIWRSLYRDVGAILYHSPEEQEFAQTELGINHPGAVRIGTWLDTNLSGQSGSHEEISVQKPYVLYCGRYSAQKNVPLLIEYATKYQEQFPGRFDFVFVGQGDVELPQSAWCKNLGFADEITKRTLLAEASALIQLSVNESLSLVALEAWIEGTPVIADAECAPLAGMIERSGGGGCIADYESFADVLNRLHENPDVGRQWGRNGQKYAQEEFGNQDAFTARIVEAIRSLSRPLEQRMRDAARRRARSFSRTAWRERFGQAIERVMDGPSRPYRQAAIIEPRVAELRAATGASGILVPVRITNTGTHALVPSGPARVVLRAESSCGTVHDTPLPSVLAPGQQSSALMRVAGPKSDEANRATLTICYAEALLPIDCNPATVNISAGTNANHGDGGCAHLIDSARAALAEAESRHRLPDDYLDVTQGALASWKLQVKKKLLGNFKHAYVDVLSRQQSAFNLNIVQALQELAECCELLDPRGASQIEDLVKAGKAGEIGALIQNLTSEIEKDRVRLTELERRLARLERAVERASSPAEPSLHESR